LQTGGKKTYLEQEKLERNTVSPVDLALEVEALDEVVIFSSHLLLGDPLGVYLCVFTEVRHRVIPRRLAIYPVRVGLVYPDPATLLLVGNLGFLDQALDQIFNRPVLWNQYVELVLEVVSISCVCSLKGKCKKIEA
jgi:hypothetical protein